MKRVLVGGVFDILHPGHAWFLKKAKQYGDCLVVVVARDATVDRKKGRKPLLSEAQRLEMVKSLEMVDEAVLGAEKDFLETVRKVKPDAVVLGFDQQLDHTVTDYLKQESIPVHQVPKKKEGGLLSTSAILEKARQQRYDFSRTE